MGPGRERGEEGERCTRAEHAISEWFRVWVRYLEEFLDYEGCLDGGDAAGRDEDDVRMSFAPAVCRSKTFCHVVSRSRSVSLVVLWVSVCQWLHTGDEMPRHSRTAPPSCYLNIYLFTLIYFPDRSLMTAKLNLNLKFLSANQVSDLESGDFESR